MDAPSPQTISTYIHHPTPWRFCPRPRPRPAEHTILHDRWIIYDLQTKWPFKLSTQFAATSAFFFEPLSFCIYPPWSMREIMNAAGIQCLLWTWGCDEIRRTNHLSVENNGFMSIMLSYAAKSPFQVKVFRSNNVSTFNVHMGGSCVLKKKLCDRESWEFIFKVLVDKDKL